MNAAPVIVRLTIGDIRKVGLRKLPYGPNTQIANDRSIPLLDIGTMEHVRAGRIRVHPGIERFTATGVVFTDGTWIDVDAVVLATGGPGLMFGKTTNSTINFGSATSAAYKQGVWYGNPEMVQIHPTGIPGSDKLRLISESARGEGGRVWVPRKAGDKRAWNEIPPAERYYFLEERYPLYGNLVPRDIASREIALICTKEGLGIGGRQAVYLDLTHQPEEYLLKKLGAILDIYCLLYTSPSPRDRTRSRMPSSA